MEKNKMKRLLLTLAMMASTVTLYPMAHEAAQLMSPQDLREYQNLEADVARFNAEIPSENFDMNAQTPQYNTEGTEFLGNNINRMLEFKRRMLRLLSLYPHDPRVQVFRSVCADVDTYFR
jgi:hypothetical protein